MQKMAKDVQPGECIGGQVVKVVEPGTYITVIKYEGVLGADAFKNDALIHVTPVPVMEQLRQGFGVLGGA